MKIAAWIFIIVLVWRIGYKYVASNPQIRLSQKISTSIEQALPWISNPTYTVKTNDRRDVPGQDIYVYDSSWSEVFSLLSQDPHYFFQLVDTSLVIDLWTSASQRTVDVYDIPSKTKIFTSLYYPSEKESLLINNTTMQFYYGVWKDSQWTESKPVNAPSCSGQYNGYVEMRSFNLLSHKIDTTGIFTCAYFE